MKNLFALVLVLVGAATGFAQTTTPTCPAHNHGNVNAFRGFNRFAFNPFLAQQLYAPQVITVPQPVVTVPPVAAFGGQFSATGGCPCQQTATASIPQLALGQGVGCGGTGVAFGGFGYGGLNTGLAFNQGFGGGGFFAQTIPSLLGFGNPFLFNGRFRFRHR